MSPALWGNSSACVVHIKGSIQLQLKSSFCKLQAAISLQQLIDLFLFFFYRESRIDKLGHRDENPGHMKTLASQVKTLDAHIIITIRKWWCFPPIPRILRTGDDDWTWVWRNKVSVCFLARQHWEVSAEVVIERKRPSPSSPPHPSPLPPPSSTQSHKWL